MYFDLFKNFITYIKQISTFLSVDRVLLKYKFACTL